MATQLPQPLQLQPDPEPRGNALLRRLRMVVVTVLGGSIVLAGVVLLVLPGPGVLVILAGLALLATEYAWARWLLHRAREQARRLKGSLRRRTARQAPAPGGETIR